jgi:hypothetical protein
MAKNAEARRKAGVSSISADALRKARKMNLLGGSGAQAGEFMRWIACVPGFVGFPLKRLPSRNLILNDRRWHVFRGMQGACSATCRRRAPQWVPPLREATTPSLRPRLTRRRATVGAVTDTDTTEDAF